MERGDYHFIDYNCNAGISAKWHEPGVGACGYNSTDSHLVAGDKNL